MALDKFTQITKSGIVTTINFECHHLHSTGIATFSAGSISALNGTFSGDVSIGGTLTYQDVTNIDSVGLVTARLGLNVTAGVSTFAAAIDANGGVDISGGSGLVASTAKISDLTDNRVVIGGSSGELEDSANLTFDGSNLGVGSKVTVTNANADSRNVNSLGVDINAAWIRLGDKAASKTFSNGLGIKFHDSGTAHWSTGTIGNQYYVSYTGSAGDELFPSSRVDALTFNTTGAAVFASDITAGGNLYIPDKIYHTGDTNTFIKFDTDTVTFETAGDERLRITSTGKIGINETSPDALLHLKNIATAGITAGIRLESSGTNNNAGDTMGQIEFAHADSNDAGVSATIKCSAEDSAGNTYLTFNNGNPGSVDERLRISSTGKIIIGNSGTAYGNGSVQSFIAHTANAGTSGFNSIDTTSVAAGVGGEISFYGKYNSGAQDYAYLGHIRGIKENATAGNTACALTFHTRPTATAPVERLRITSGGLVGIGTDDPAQPVHISRGSAIARIQSTDATTSARLEIIGANDSYSGLHMGDVDDVDVGAIRYYHGGSDPNHMQFKTAGSERLRITSTGWQKGHTAYAGVGINTFASWARTGGAIRGEVGYNAVTLDYMYFGTGTLHPLALRMNNTTALFIDTNKRLLVGNAETIAYKSNLNSSADTAGQIAQFVGKNDDASHCVGIFAYSGTSNPTARGAKLQLHRARSTDGTTNTPLANNDLIGTIEFKGNDGTSFTAASKIDCFVEDSSVAADDMGGRLVFSTTAEGGHTPTERLRITSGGTLYSYSPDDVTPNIAIRSNDTNWHGYLTQTVHGGTISSILSCGGKWNVDGTTYAATKDYNGSFSTGALVVHNQYNGSQTGAELVFLSKANGSSTTDGTVSERLRITSGGQMRVNPPATNGGSTVLAQQALIGTKHIYTAYHNFSSTNSNMNITSIKTNSCGELWIIGGWANGNGLRMKKYTWVASGDTAITEQSNTFASRYGVGITINTPTMSISGDYVHFNFTFSDNQGSKLEKLKIHFEYFYQFKVDS